MKSQKFILLLSSIFCTLILNPHAVLACTEEFKPVCGYWMHTAKTQSFANECKMREAGAKIRHAGSCADQKPSSSVTKPNSK
jgi:hypothetical protein